MFTGALGDPAGAEGGQAWTRGAARGRQESTDLEAQRPGHQCLNPGLQEPSFKDSPLDPRGKQTSDSPPPQESQRPMAPSHPKIYFKAHMASPHSQGRQDGPGKGNVEDNVPRKCCRGACHREHNPPVPRYAFKGTHLLLLEDSQTDAGTVFVKAYTDQQRGGS